MGGGNIPFHKYGGLKFIEAAHVKDLLAFLRLAENPRDLIAGSRLLALLPGIGPHKAKNLMAMLAQPPGGFAAWREWKPPGRHGGPVAAIRGTHRGPGKDQQRPSPARSIACGCSTSHFWSSATTIRSRGPATWSNSNTSPHDTATGKRCWPTSPLDPPSSTQDLAGAPQLDDDYLILSTIHSAKGLEWDCVYVIHAADGNIPSDMSTGTPEGVEEELRLFYVALTRAKRWLYVCCPLRYYHSRGGFGDSHGYAQLTRFLAKPGRRLFPAHRERFGRRNYGCGRRQAPHDGPPQCGYPAQQTKSFWD